MSMPESDPRKTVVRATLLGILSEFPGGGGLAGAIQGAAEAASRARDEDWWAMVAARVGSLEGDVQKLVRFDDPEFLATLHRITRAAQETSDEGKRARLAAALAHGGSWSDLPVNRRVRMERLVAVLSTQDVNMLWILHDQFGWLREHDPLAAAEDGAGYMDSQGFLLRHIVWAGVATREEMDDALANLFENDLTVVIQSSMTIDDDHLTEAGVQFIEYLRDIEG